MSVAHRADVQVLFSLFVTLLEELLHQKVDPSFVQVQRFGGVAQVRAMHQVLQDLSDDEKNTLSLTVIRTARGNAADRYLYPVGVVVQQQYPRTGHFFRFHHRFQVGQQTHVFGHVGGQYLHKGMTTMTLRACRFRE